jgi:signal transduction histidine kinase
MSAITMRLNYIRRLMEKNPQDAPDELYQIEELARSTTREIRAMLFTLRPKALEQGLSAGLEQLARQMQETYGQDVRVEVQPGIDVLLDSQTEQTLFSIATEATTNARKHSGAEIILLRTYRQAGAFVLEVYDNGAGFDVNEAIAEARQREGHLGLINLFDRASLIDGTLHIDSRPSRGTRLLVAVPLDVLEQRKAEEQAETIRKQH